jgi:hypothetical protein
MFLNTIKNFLLKNKTTKLLSNTNISQSEGFIKSVGVIYDGNLIIEIENLVYELFKQGIEEDKIKVLIFKDKINNKEVSKFDVISYNDINWSGAIENQKAKLFLNTQFDLLINYHDFENDEDVINRIIELDNDDHKLNDMKSQTWFNNNQVNEYIDENNIALFFKKIFQNKINPIANSWHIYPALFTRKARSLKLKYDRKMNKNFR